MFPHDTVSRTHDVRLLLANYSKDKEQQRRCLFWSGALPFFLCVVAGIPTGWISCLGWRRRWCAQLLRRGLADGNSNQNTPHEILQSTIG